MSTRTVSVKTHNSSTKHHNNFVSHKSISVSTTTPTVSKSKNTNQQPKKNYQKLQATQHQKHGRKSKKPIVTVTVDDDTSSFSSSSSSSEEEQPQQHYHQPRNYNKYKSNQFVDQVYAGPTFNNAPAPSALPIPAFNARGSPINYPQPLYHSVNPSLQQQSLDLMNLITPQKVITAYELEKTNLALSEIQRGLRSMLKIES